VGADVRLSRLGAGLVSSGSLFNMSSKVDLLGGSGAGVDVAVGAGAATGIGIVACCAGPGVVLKPGRIKSGFGDGWYCPRPANDECGVPAIDGIPDGGNPCTRPGP